MRFPEFTEEWRKYKVSDVLDFYSTNSLSWEQLDYNNEDLYNLHYGLIHVGLPILVDIEQNKLPGIKTECKPKNFELCKEGDVAFADASEDTNDVAKAIEFVNLNNHKTICGLHTIHGRDNKHLTVLGYKGYAFASPLFHNQIRRIAQGTKIYSISSKNFAECYIGIPSKDEQSKIARLLALIDSRIATQNKIIEKLESLIKGLCSFLFDKNKYDSFVRLGDISEITNGNSDVQDASLSYSKGMYPFFDRSNDVKFLPEYILDKESIIYPGEGSEFYPRYYNGKFALHQRCYAIYDISRNFKPKYLYYFCKTQNSYFVRNAVGSTVASLRLDTFKRLNIPHVPIEVQETYVQLLDKIETKIIDNKAILKKYEEQKKYLLSNLFI
ncbi:restriction endonuclease subunit S [Bacteroides xylanisolvens]|uniref:restriction endonuclease subunit S n=1 Tax=Bacteroides xylanisolvens TaxID=371601 RepID=UPI001CDB9F36|nr:restriction endonuclease subunit S [Bacteroides xylanisolvens]MCA4475623.1 restriction endonuclease subunit S [Bacteroides xylanisolvens]